MVDTHVRGIPQAETDASHAKYALLKGYQRTEQQTRKGGRKAVRAFPPRHNPQNESHSTQVCHGPRTALAPGEATGCVRRRGPGPDPHTRGVETRPTPVASRHHRDTQPHPLPGPPPPRQQQLWMGPVPWLGTCERLGALDAIDRRGLCCVRARRRVRPCTRPAPAWSQPGGSLRAP